MERNFAERIYLMQKALRSALLFILVLSTLLGISCGQDGKKKEKSDFIYEISDNKVTITGYSGLDGDVVIPSVIEDLPVTKIAENAFNGMINLKSITLPDSVMVIDYAFVGCPELERATLGNGIISMSGAFKNCKKLTEVTGGKSATQMSEAFMNCVSLTSGMLPANAVGTVSAFRGCKKLTEVTVGEGITSLPYTFEGCTALLSVTLPSTVKDAAHAFEGCTALTEVIGAEHLTDLDSTFVSCSRLSSLALGDGVKTLKNAFTDCASLSNIENLPSEVEEYSSSFKGCTSLTAVVIPKSASGGKDYDISADISGLSSAKDITVYADFFVTGEFCKTFSGCSSLENLVIPDSAAEALLRVDAMFTDALYTGTNKSVKNAVNKCKKASNVRITDNFGYIGETSYTHIYGGDVAAFSPEDVAASKSIIGFESFSQSYYWCGYPSWTNRKNTTVAIERTYTFYLRVTGGNDGTLPFKINVNGMECAVEDN